MYRDAFQAAGFDGGKAKGVDIRNMSTEQAVEAIKALITSDGA